MTRIAHGFASRVVLIGSSGGDAALRDVLARRLGRLRDLLVDDVRWGLDEGNCTVLVDPPGDAELSLALRAAADGAGRGGLLFVLYAGPVRMESEDRLLLVLPGRAFDYEEARWRVRFSPATRRLVVLDCRGTAATAEAVADAAAFDRGVLLVRAPGPDDDRNDLTAHLADVLERGVPHGPTLLGPLELARTFPGAPLTIRPDPAPAFPLVRNPALFQADRAGQVLLTAGDDAVILILRHDPHTGALGLIVNRPGTDAPVTPDWPGAVQDPGVVFDGGPVRHEGFIALALLHAGAEPPAPFRRIGSRLGMLPLSCRADERVVERFRLFRGYVGWGPGELEADIASGSVVRGEFDLDLVLTAEPDALRQLAREGLAP